MKRGGPHNKHTYVKQNSNISNETTETVYFRLSHYKTGSTSISGNSIQSSYPYGIKKKQKKNRINVEAYFLSMYIQLQLRPPYGF